MARRGHDKPKRQPKDRAIPIPPNALTRLKRFQEQRNQLDSLINTYIQGVLNGLDLSGTWTLNLDKGVIVPQQNAQKPEPSQDGQKDDEMPPESAEGGEVNA